MAVEQNKQKQDADADTTQAGQDGYTADELGAASSYDDPTQIAQQMRRGDESKGDPNARDVVGATDFRDAEEGRTDQDTVPHDKNEGN